MYNGDGVKICQAIGYISENSNLIREGDIGVFSHAVIEVDVQVLHNDADVCFVASNGLP